MFLEKLNIETCLSVAENLRFHLMQEAFQKVIFLQTTHILYQSGERTRFNIL